MLSGLKGIFMSVMVKNLTYPVYECPGVEIPYWIWRLPLSTMLQTS